MRTTLILLAALVLIALPARAQLLWVTGDYRVVLLDKERHRIGIALQDAPASAGRQNWCYLNLDSTLFMKVYDADGWTKEERIPSHQILDILRPGDPIRVQGGRAFDLSITARKIWLDRKPD